MFPFHPYQVLNFKWLLLQGVATSTSHWLHSFNTVVAIQPSIWREKAETLWLCTHSMQPSDGFPATTLKRHMDETLLLWLLSHHFGKTMLMAAFFPHGFPATTERPNHHMNQYGLISSHQKRKESCSNVFTFFQIVSNSGDCLLSGLWL